MSRIGEINREAMTPAQRRVHDEIAAGPRGGVRGPFPALLGSPGLCDPVQKAGAYLRYESGVPARLRELAILCVVRYWGAAPEWLAHAPLAAAEGLAGQAIDALRRGVAPRFAEEAERTVHAFCRETLTAKRVSAPTFEAARALLGEEGLVDLIGLIGYYSLVSFALNGFEIAPPDGESPWDEICLPAETQEEDQPG